MRETIREYKWTLLITAVIILLPILPGMYFWDRLPEQVATHWGIYGEPNGWSSRGFAVFGMPLFLLAMQVLCLVMDKYNVHAKQNRKIMLLILWIIPVISLFCGFSIYGYALGYDMQVQTIAPVLVGVLFMLVGNYLPKCRQNRTVGIKIPWTLGSEANWTATHRFAGKLWVAAGVVMLIGVFLPEKAMGWILLPVMLSVALIPMAYSYLYARRNGEADKEEDA